jgi:hypothetical protein
MRSRRLAFAAMSPSLVLGVALSVAACTIGGPSAAPATPAGTATPATTAPTTPGSASPTPTPVSGTAACDPASLTAAITAWEGAAGHRNATVTLTNNGKGTCSIHALAKPQLVDANGTVLIDGGPPTSPSTLDLAYYDVVSTMVSDANYCGAAPTGPVTVAFVFPGGEGRVVATAAPGDPLAGVPPCNGGAGTPGDIEMQPFAP